ncbi:MAG: LAGLIDADG family homing endonuclease [Nanoarchaeota archaeon]|nr:LAGLIDADG family homing endonuclease [Nanoarchaeota archaeon]
MVLKINFKQYLKTYNTKLSKAIYYPKILRLKKKGLSLKSIENLYDNLIPKSTLYFWYTEKRIPRIFLSFLKAKKKFSKEDMQTFAHVIGNIIGDGGITNKGYTHYCNTEKFLIKKFKNNMERIFPEEKPCITNHKNATHLTYSPRVGRIIWCLFGKFSFGKDTKKITIGIISQPLKWKMKLLTSLYDDDGSAVKLKQGGYISLKQKLKGIILFVQITLAECNIKSMISYDQGKWLLRISSYKEMLKFKKEINFSKDYRKRERLDEILSTIKYPHFITKQKIVDFLKTGPKSFQNITEQFNLKRGTLHGHLRGWRKDSKEDGLIKNGIIIKIKAGKEIFYMLN